MKKVLSTVLAVVMLASSAIAFSSCDTKHKCDFCGEEKKCVEKTVMGESMYICDDCIDEINEFYE